MVQLSQELKKRREIFRKVRRDVALVNCIEKRRDMILKDFLHDFVPTNYLVLTDDVLGESVVFRGWSCDVPDELLLCEVVCVGSCFVGEVCFLDEIADNTGLSIRIMKRMEE